MPRLVAAGTSTLSTPTPARPIACRLVGVREQLGVELRRRADQDAVVAADPLEQLARGSSRSRSRRRSLRRAAARSPESPMFSATSTLRHAAACSRWRSTTQSMQAVSARTSSGSIAGNIADPQLVAAELAVGLDVDDAVGAQRRRDGRGVDAVVEVDRADDQRALGRVGDERRRVRRRLGPGVEVVARTRSCARRSSRGRPGRSSSRAARRAGTASRAPACCRSGP